VHHIEETVVVGGELVLAALPELRAGERPEDGERGAACSTEGEDYPERRQEAAPGTARKSTTTLIRRTVGWWMVLRGAGVQERIAQGGAGSRSFP
jgi:hypothetical protein